MSRPPADEWPRAHDLPDEHDPSLADDVMLDAAGDEEMRHDERYDERYDEPYDGPRRGNRSSVVRWVAILVAIAVVVGGGWTALQVVGNLVPSFTLGADAPEDYEGEGSGEVSVEIPEGAGGVEIGQVLAELEVVASAEAFANVAAADPRSTSIQPGTYSMARQMSSSAALDRLVDGNFRQVVGVTVREGLWKEEVFAVLSEATDTPIEDYEAVDLADLPLPEAADGNLEGYLFPDTYEFPPAATAQEQLHAMVDLGAQRYEELGLTDGEDLQRTIITASLVQAEGFNPEDLPRIARVVENRLEDGEALGFDSTIHFIFKERGRAGTTDEQRETEHPYNTYLNSGLPPGPINSPGTSAIEAAMNPAEGDWKYFVTVDPSTGETKFAETFEEHLQNQEEFQQWCRDNPDQC